MVEASKLKIDSCLLFFKVSWVAGANWKNFEEKRVPKTQ